MYAAFQTVRTVTLCKEDAKRETEMELGEPPMT